MTMVEGHGSGDERSAGQISNPVHERLLRLLGMSNRPLNSCELQRALALTAHEARSACRWLIDEGYIVGTPTQASSEETATVWSLAERGRAWAQDQGALLNVRPDALTRPEMSRNRRSVHVH